jgi:hypothetical protein
MIPLSAGPKIFFGPLHVMAVRAGLYAELRQPEARRTSPRQQVGENAGEIAETIP